MVRKQSKCLSGKKRTLVKAPNGSKMTWVEFARSKGIDLTGNMSAKRAYCIAKKNILPVGYREINSDE